MRSSPITSCRCGIGAALSFAAQLVLSACATPAPTALPSVVVPSEWHQTAPSSVPQVATPADPTDLVWRDFGTPELDTLIETALRNNRDLKIAAARIAQARAQSAAARADRLPQLGLAAGAQRGRQSSADPQTDLTYSGFQASWELDLVGRKALTHRAAERDAESADLASGAMRISLAAEVATTYFDIATLIAREAIARDSVATLARQVEVAARRFTAGQATRLDIDRLQAELSGEKATATQLQGERQAKLAQLGVLVGDATMPGGLTYTLPESVTAAMPPTVLPADLLERRPDVLRQARALDAATARLGVARRDIYPRIEFDWSGRKERLTPQGIDASGAPTIVIGYGVTLSLPLFDGGRIRANIAFNEARVDEAMMEYEKSMLVALADAETALTQFVATNAVVADAAQARAAASAAATKADRLFAAGMVDLNAVLDVRRSDLRASDALLRSRNTRLAATIGLRRAFAGNI